MSTAPCRDPVMMNCPARRYAPSGCRVRTSQATACSGLPSAAAPAPVAISSPLRVSTMPTSRRSRPAAGGMVGASTTPPLRARPAMVSASLIFQSAIRLSTISRAGTAPLMAAATSRAEQAGPRRSAASPHAISASVRADGRGQHRGEVGGGDAQQLLHGRAGQAELVADDPLTVGDQPVEQFLL